MSNIAESTITMYKGVNVMRDMLPLARVFFDLHVHEDGIGGYAVWQTNTYRIPGISHLRDFLARRKRLASERSEVLKEDERHFYFDFKNIQGIVSDGFHKELQILTNEEQMSIHFRWPEDYESLIEKLEENVSEKIFSRDGTEVKASVYV